MKSLRSGISEKIAKKLREQIITGELEPGCPLRQDHIAEEFHTSHVPVREALQSLQAEDLVSYFPRKGASVSLLSEADIQEIIDIRIELESLALKCAMLADEGINLPEIEALIEIENNANSIDSLVSINCSYHRTLYLPCKRNRLLSIIEELWVHSERYLRAVWKNLDYQDQSHFDHEEILLRVKQNDVSRAVDLSKKHIRRAGDELIKILPEINLKGV